MSLQDFLLLYSWISYMYIHPINSCQISLLIIFISSLDRSIISLHPCPKHWFIQGPQWWHQGPRFLFHVSTLLSTDLTSSYSWFPSGCRMVGGSNHYPMLFCSCSAGESVISRSCLKCNNILSQKALENSLLSLIALNWLHTYLSGTHNSGKEDGLSMTRGQLPTLMAGVQRRVKLEWQPLCPQQTRECVVLQQFKAT